MQKIPAVSPEYRSLNRAMGTIDDNFDTVNENVSKLQPITDSYTAEVGVGKDFELFHDAMVWVMKQATTGNATITLILDDQTHYIGEPSDFLTWYFWTYYTVQSAVLIKSASGNPALCKITMPATNDWDMWPGIFTATGGGFLTLEKITIDPALGGYPYPNHVAAVVASNATARLSTAIVENAGSGAQAYNGGYFGIYNSTINACETGISLNSGSKCVDTSGSKVSTISGNILGISCTNGSVVTLNDSTTFSGNTTDTNIPINQIQYDGACIADTTAALSFKP